jgi:hypothetical protein
VRGALEMIDREDRALAALDIHFRIQLVAAADTYASRIDLDARLQAVLAADKDNDRDGNPVEKS